MAADFLAKNTAVKRVWVSNPSWPNHKSVFNSAGLEVREYAYYDAANHALDFDGLLASLSEARRATWYCSTAAATTQPALIRR